MKAIIFIGCNKSGTSREALKLSESLGYFTILFTDREKFIEQRKEFYEVHQMIYFNNLLDLDLLKHEIRLLQMQAKEIMGCISMIDPFVHLAASLTKELGIANLSTEALYLMEDKTRVREALKEHPVTPFFDIYWPKEEHLLEYMERIQINLPLIIKSPVSNGSKDVFLVETKESLKQVMKRLSNKNPNSPILLEEYLSGPQFLVEVIVYKNHIHIIGVIGQEFSELNRFIVTDYSFPAILEEKMYVKLEETVNSVITCLGLKNGSCHLELRLVNEEWKLIEINPRMSGGAMNRIIYEGSGTNLVKETIALYLGEEPKVKCSHKQYINVKYLTVGTRGKLLKVTGKGRALKFAGVKDVYIKPRKGSVLGPPLSMGDRYAYVLAAASDPETARKIAINAAKEIKFYLEPL